MTTKFFLSLCTCLLLCMACFAQTDDLATLDGTWQLEQMSAKDISKKQQSYYKMFFTKGLVGKKWTFDAQNQTFQIEHSIESESMTLNEVAKRGTNLVAGKNIKKVAGKIYKGESSYFEGKTIYQLDLQNEQDQKYIPAEMRYLDKAEIQGSNLILQNTKVKLVLKFKKV